MLQTASSGCEGRAIASSFRIASAWAISVACIFVAFLGTAARAEPPESGMVRIESATYKTLTDVIRGEKGEPFELEANLQFPDIEKKRYPAVVLLHTIGSYRESNEGWYAEQYRKAGYATLTYESIKTRRMHEAHTQGAGRLWGSLTADAYSALKFLAAHPRIDPKRIAVTGYSLGGEVTRLISFEVVRKAFIEGDLKYAAHVAVYPCHTWAVMAGERSFTGAPVLEQLGGKDDCGPIAKTEMHVAYHKANGHPAPVTFVIYAEANHNWSDSTAGPAKFYPSLASPSKCPLILLRETSYAFLRGGEVEPWDGGQYKECGKESRGYTRGFDAQVRDQSFADALAFIQRAMGEK